ncbi:hypothetical protein EON83_13960 [bacterium]|nr:MAG: hypothetical protein EON83_13960 [bacterium]
MNAPISPSATQSASLSPDAIEQQALKPAGLTLRAAVLSLGLAFFFGYMIPVVDMKMRNTFLGATHFPPGAIAVLLVLLLSINPLLKIMARDFKKVATVGAAMLLCAGISALCFARAGSPFSLPSQSPLLEWIPLSLASLLSWALGTAAALMLLTLGLGRRPLARNEMLTVYISCLFSALAPGHGAENVFVVNLIGPFYYATRENKWLEWLEPSIRPWMTPAMSQNGRFDEAARGTISGWFTNTPSGEIPWSAWLVPVLAWGGAIFLMYIMMGCLCVMLRKQWAEREALAFPLLRFPLQLTEDVDNPQAGLFDRFFSNQLMWIGVGIAVFIQMLRGLNLYFSDIPSFPLEIPTGPLFTEAPWNQIGWTPMMIWPIAVGITYFLTSEVSFSLWFFYLFVRLQFVVAYLLGFAPNTIPQPVGLFGGPAKAWTFYQSFGCLLAYVFLVLWTGREHIRHIVLRATGRRRAGSSESEEALSYPLAFWGFTGSFGLLVVWSHAAGINWALAFTIWAFYCAVIIGLSRIISEAGLLFVQPNWTPLGTLGEIFGTGPGHALISSSSLPPASMIQGALMSDLRGFLMPSFIQGFKLAHDRKIALKPLFALVMACSLITFAMGTYFNIKFGYQIGGSSLDPWYAGDASKQPAFTSAALIKGVTTASWLNLLWIAVGGAMTVAFMAARSHFAWFPLHPIGFILSQTYPLNTLWFSIFLGWLAKVTITRFGGSDSYRKTTPLFLGLALGDVAMMLFWLVIDGWQGRVGHKLMPG